MDRIIIELPTEGAELMNVLDAYLDWLYRHPAESSPKTPDDPDAEEESPGETVARPGLRARRVDALLDLVEHAAYEHHDRVDVERAAIGVTVDYDTLPGARPGLCDLGSGGDFRLREEKPGLAPRPATSYAI